MILFCWISFLLSIGNSFANTIKPSSSEKHVYKGENVILSCNYTGNVNNLQWYRQYLGSRPEFLVLVTEYSDPPDPSLHLSAKAMKDIKRVDLMISSAEETDSAVYYCALEPQGINKIVFGTGTQLTVLSKEKLEPSIYKVNNDTDCLATDFTRHDAVDNNPAFTDQNVTVRYEGQSTYSAFALGTGESCNEENGCAGESSNQIFESDEKMNFMTVGIFWLRILFLKTVVFNVLMTFKAWMS